ncbi:hypothetical protein [Aquibacillus saliphilus]|nr:hypothetical protein [Aquibacillus saliphilus]
MSREEKIEFLCEKYNEKPESYADTPDSTIDMIYNIAYYGS